MSLEINKRITECRQNAKITKKEMAERLGIKYTTYCRMEKEAKRITIAEVEKIADVIGTDPEYILYGRTNYSFAKPEPNILVAESPNKDASPFDEPKSPVITYAPDDFVCSSEEKALITMFRNLSPEKKQSIRKYIDELK